MARKSQLFAMELIFRVEGPVYINTLPQPSLHSGKWKKKETWSISEIFQNCAHLSDFVYYFVGYNINYKYLPFKYIIST